MSLLATSVLHPQAVQKVQFCLFFLFLYEHKSRYGGLTPIASYNTNYQLTASSPRTITLKNCYLCGYEHVNSETLDSREAEVTGNCEPANMGASNQPQILGVKLIFE